MDPIKQEQPRFVGFYEYHELPIRKGQTVTIKKGTPIRHRGQTKLAKRTYQVKVHHILPGRSETRTLNGFGDPIPLDPPSVVWPGEGSYWSEVDMNLIPEAINALPSLAEAERRLGEKASKWAGRCYEIACAFVRYGLVKGTPVYGHFVGDVHPDSYFGKRPVPLPFVQHGWVLLADGSLFDPTRWGFDGKDPYLYFGTSAHGHPDYDEGGNQLRATLRRPVPAFDPSAKKVEMTSSTLSSAPWKFVEKILEIDITVQDPGVLTVEQVFWLANLPLADLKEHAKDIYSAIEKVGLVAAIPYDNRMRVIRENS